MNKYLSLSLIIFLLACKNDKKETPINHTLLQHQCVQKLTDVIVYDIFTPPVASRIYAYSNLAFYEAYIGDADSLSITSHLKGFKKINGVYHVKTMELSNRQTNTKTTLEFLFEPDNEK